ncbi:hypothetical protein [Streptomyces sp. NPDC052012]|uniref:hypothetical protein n=1 Tax=Streptomyces sp. NPDC052012 TaxID=3155051 RepID=UPI00344F358D
MERSAQPLGTPAVALLSIGVGSFDDGADLEELGFVRARVDEIGRAFHRLHATVEESLDATEGEIEALLRARLVEQAGALDVVVVHLIGHGRVDRGHRLSFVARDNREVDVDRWIEKAQREVERGGMRHRVVFLVDTCSAGTATGRQPFTELDVDRGVWAIGASVSDSPTERGQFSSWIAAALHRLADRDLTLDEEAIAFSRFVRELIRVIRGEGQARRFSLGFSVEQGDADWPFLPNPRLASLTAEQIQIRRRSLGYVPGEGDLGTGAPQHVDDTRYFADRASGRGLVPTDTGTGFFSGRSAELSHYRRWLSGEAPLLTVTGAAGAGKSALLGVIVCAADPQLRRRFRELWESAGRDLPEVPGLVAVHARQRTAQQVIGAIADRAGLATGAKADGTGRADGTDDAADTDSDTDSAAEPGGPAGAASTAAYWTAGRLRHELRQDGARRVIVLDAVDESTEPQAVLRLVTDLLRPGSADGEPVAAPCRIVLGGRREIVTALSAFEDAADIAGDHIDLDAAERRTVEEDVRHYIERLLSAREPYATGASAEFVRLLAKKGAHHIAGGPPQEGPWGPFLLAGLYVHYLLTLRHPPQDEAGADAYAKSASADLPALLESILKTRRHDYPSLRAVLAVLARSRGDGMPRTTLRRCLAAFDAGGIDDEQFRDTLQEASPFLRYGSDPDSGDTLYRLFHQGLADYLRLHPVSEDPLEESESAEVERRLLAELVRPFTSDADAHTDTWEAAEDEPYVLRHALAHAARAEAVEAAESLLGDPYFVVRFDLREDHRAFDLVRASPAADHIRLLSASWAAHARLRSPSDRASLFAFDADRLGLHELRERFTRIARDTTLQPEAGGDALLWSQGGQATPSSRFIESASDAVTDIAFSPDGGLLAVATPSGVRLLEAETWRPAVPALGREQGRGWTNALAFSPDGRLLAVGRHEFSRSVQLWDVHHRVPAGPPWPVWTGTPTALAFSPDSRRLAVGSEELGVSVWDITGDGPVEVARREPRDDAHEFTRVRDVSFSPDGSRLAVCGSAGAALWDPEGDCWSPLPDGRFVDVVAFTPDGRQVVSAGFRQLSLHSAEDPSPGTEIALNGRAKALAFSSDGSVLAVSCGESIDVIDMESARVVNSIPLGSSRAAVVALHPVTGVLVSGHSDGELRVWPHFSEPAQTPDLARFTSNLVVAASDGRFLAALDDRRRMLRLLDPADGATLASRHHDVRASQLVLAPDGNTLLVASYRLLQVYRTGSLRLQGPEVVDLAGWLAEPPVFSPDGRLVAALVLQERRNVCFLTVWDARTLRTRRRIPLPGRPDTAGFAGNDRVYAVVNEAVGTFSCADTEPEAPLE